jgi:hypothetical protein
MFTIPMFIAYGIIKSYPPYYYPWLIVLFILISVIPVLIAALDSIPTMFVYVFLNRVKILQYLLYASATACGILLLWHLISLVPDNINFVESWGDTFWEIQAFLSDTDHTNWPKNSALPAFLQNPKDGILFRPHHT